MVGEAAALIPLAFGLYALSGAGVIRRLPLVRTALIGIGSLFLLRGLFMILTFLVALGVLQGKVPLPGVASHLVFLSAGIVYLGGAALNGKTLKSRQPVGGRTASTLLEPAVLRTAPSGRDSGRVPDLESGQPS